MNSILTYAMTVLTVIPELIEAGKDVYDLVEATNTKLKVFVAEKRDPSTEEWTELNSRIAEKRKALHSS